jgi:hypothetical protein
MLAPGKTQVLNSSAFPRKVLDKSCVDWRLVRSRDAHPEASLSDTSLANLRRQSGPRGCEEINLVAVRGKA